MLELTTELTKLRSEYKLKFSSQRFYPSKSNYNKSDDINGIYAGKMLNLISQLESVDWSNKVIFKVTDEISSTFAIVPFKTSPPPDLTPH